MRMVSEALRQFRIQTGAMVCAAFCTLVPVRVSQAADPFYERLLTEGTVAYTRQEYVLAVKKLRTAVFGMLDEPARLAEGLCVLGLAQAGMNDTQAFMSTFLRLAEVETRFQGYSTAQIDPALRADFEKTAARLVPRSTLEITKAFPGLIDAQEADRISAKRPAERRAELQRLIKERPGEPRWALLLARLELDEDNTDDAVRAVSGALARDPVHPDALLIRGLAHARKEEWSDAASDLSASGRAAADVRTAEALLRALVELQRWADANQFLGSLGVQVRGDKRIRGLVEKAKAGLARKADQMKKHDSPKKDNQ